MGRTTWFDVDGMRKGEWTAEEDQKLVSYINQYGICDWRSLPIKAGLQRCGKSCRLRWLNYLRPGIRRGKFTPEEEEDIIKLHALLGNRWAAIAKQMQNRTDNDVKNHWNSCLKKRLLRSGIDPMTHEPIIISKNDECSSSSTTTLSPSSSSFSGSARLLNKLAAGISSRQHSLDRIKNILSSDPKITNSDQEEEEELKMDQMIGGGEEEEEEEEEEELRMDHKIGFGEEGDDDFQIWDEEEVRRLLDIDVMDYETTSYDSVLYESSTHVLDHFF